MIFKNALWVLFISMLPIIELRGAVPVGAALGVPFYINFLCALVGNLLPVPFILLLIPKVLDFLKRFKFFRPIVEWLRKKALSGRKKIVKNEKAEGEAASAEALTGATAETFTAANTETFTAASAEALTGATAETFTEANTENVTDASLSGTALLGEDAADSPSGACDISGSVFENANEPPIIEEKRKMPAGAFIGLLLFVLLPLPGTGAWTGSLVAALFDFPKKKSLLAVTLGVIGCGIIMTLASYGVVSFLSFLL